MSDFLAALKAEAASKYPSVEFNGQTIRIRSLPLSEKPDIVIEAKLYALSRVKPGTENLPANGLQKKMLDAALSGESGQAIADFWGYVEPTTLAGQVMYYNALVSYQYFEIAHSLCATDGEPLFKSDSERNAFVSHLMENPDDAQRFKIVHAPDVEDVLGNS